MITRLSAATRRQEPSTAEAAEAAEQTRWLSVLRALGGERLLASEHRQGWCLRYMAPRRYFRRSTSGNRSIAYRSIVRGIVL